MSDIIANSNRNKARQNISTVILTATNKAKQNHVHTLWDILRLLKWLHMDTTIFITDLSPFDASPLTKLFMILVSSVGRSATIAWATILEPYNLVTSLQAVWN